MGKFTFNYDSGSVTVSKDVYKVKGKYQVLSVEIYLYN